MSEYNKYLKTTELRSDVKLQLVIDSMNVLKRTRAIVDNSEDEVNKSYTLEYIDKELNMLKILREKIAMEVAFLKKI